jgi:hypothetical protein
LEEELKMSMLWKILGVRHRNGNMEWKEAPLLNKIKPIGRY